MTKNTKSVFSTVTPLVPSTLSILMALCCILTLSGTVQASGSCNNPTLAKRWFGRHGTDSCDCGSAFVTINPANNQYNAKSSALVCNDATDANCKAYPHGAILSSTAKTMYFKNTQDNSFYSCDWTPGIGHGFSNPKPHQPGCNPVLAKRWFGRHGTDSCDCGSAFVTINPANNQYNAKSSALVCNDATGTSCKAYSQGAILSSTAKTMYFKNTQDNTVYSCNWTPGRGHGFSNPRSIP